ncbi:hypothetical protein PCL_12967 [Purpureocillium lilacinum]|uniref:Uncharacterized protein n=2 Tax=Purpureocillium lilacinum TaxID=33203 RepID=A0A2U3E7R8_PURLI|nr:hypothetical protein Purlil1_6095 [Purpureocillium lilacinum]PWI70568.1 hypothetical protein PCL_12967 [Purpureocillium lilacinum]
MKASIAISTLIQGLAIATPVKVPETEGAQFLEGVTDEPGAKATTGDTLSTEQRASAGKSAMGMPGLPRECFTANKLRVACGLLYNHCREVALQENGQPEATSEKFLACITENLNKQ